MTLIELLVVVILIGIIGGMILSSAIVIQRATTMTEGTNITVNEARLAASNLERRIRTAVRPRSGLPTLSVAEPQRVRFLSISDTETVPHQVEIAVVGGEVVERRWTADDATVPAGLWAYTGASTVRPLLANIDPAVALFTFYDTATCPSEDDSGAVVGSDEIDLVACVPLDAATLNLIDVDLIDVLLLAERPDGDGPPVELRTRIFLRNTIYSTQFFDLPTPTPTATP